MKWVLSKGYFLFGLFTFLCVTAIILIPIERKEKIYISEAIRSYEVVYIDPPKHFSVDLLDLETHQLFKYESNSKHCNEWRRNKLHEIVRIRTVYYKYKGSDGIYADLDNINDHFCK